MPMFQSPVVKNPNNVGWTQAIQTVGHNWDSLSNCFGSSEEVHIFATVFKKMIMELNSQITTPNTSRFIKHFVTQDFMLVELSAPFDLWIGWPRSKIVKDLNPTSLTIGQN